MLAHLANAVEISKSFTYPMRFTKGSLACSKSLLRETQSSIPISAAPCMKIWSARVNQQQIQDTWVWHACLCLMPFLEDFTSMYPNACAEGHAVQYSQCCCSRVLKLLWSTVVVSSAWARLHSKRPRFPNITFLTACTMQKPKTWTAPARRRQPAAAW